VGLTAEEQEQRWRDVADSVGPNDPAWRKALIENVLTPRPFFAILRDRRAVEG
jgi:hypothetical protein